MLWPPCTPFIIIGRKYLINTAEESERFCGEQKKRREEKEVGRSWMKKGKSTKRKANSSAGRGIGG